MDKAQRPQRRYLMKHCLGAGGFGEVYLADRTTDDGGTEEVAVKVLHSGLDPRSQAVQRLADEAKLLKLLQHPNVLACDDLLTLEGRVTLVSEYLDGADFDVILDGAERIPLPAGLEVLARVAEVLQTAWSTLGPNGTPLKLLHRDIKPSNLRLTTQGVVKVLDFGIAKAGGVTREARTGTNAVIGSFPYMAPERFEGKGTTPASDVYSLGCILYELLAGGEQLVPSDLEVRDLFSLAMVPERREAFLAPRLEKVADADPRVLQLLRELLAYVPEDRPPVETLAARIDDLADSLPGQGLARWCARRTWPAPEHKVGSLTGRTITEGAAVETSFVHVPLTTTAVVPRDRRTSEETIDLLSDDLEKTGTRVDEVDDDEPLAYRRPLWKRLGPVGLLAVFLLVALVGLGGMGVAGLYNVARTPPGAPGPQEPAPDSQGMAVAVATPEPTLPAPPKPHQPAPEPVAPEPVEVTEPVAEASACDDPSVYEGPASAGTLGTADRACLDERMRAATLQTQRQAAARVLLRDAHERCKKSDCADYERLQRYYNGNLGRSDAAMLLTWTNHLASRAGNDPARLREVRESVEWTQARQDQWTGKLFITNRNRLLELDAKAAYALHQAQPKDESARLLAVETAVNWANTAIASGASGAQAIEFCRSAATASDTCEKRITSVVATEKVTFTSKPFFGAEVTIDGEPAGKTPLNQVELPFGAHEVRLRLGETESTRTIQVGAGTPKRWTWNSEENEWSSGL